MTKPTPEQEKAFNEILKMNIEEAEVKPESVGDHPGTKTHESEINFDILPEELEEYLNKYVVSQEATVEVIATKVCTHFNRMKIEKAIPEDQRIIGNIKSNMLLIGPTGVGKTYIIKLIAKKIGVPFVKADATKFSETGYVGGDVEDLVRELVHEADGDITKAEYGIIYIDEIDKIASSGNIMGPDVSRTGVQRNLLKLMEDSDVDLKTPHDLASQVEAAMEAQRTGKVTRKKISTKNILFIVSGAFSGLEEIINRRMNRQSIGFDKQRTTGNMSEKIIAYMRTEDLIEFGFESEFVGRLPVYVVLNELDVDGLYKILKNRFSTVILGKKMDFLAYGIDLDFTDEALYELAVRAHREKTGARGLLSVFEKLLIKFEKKLPSTGIKQLLVDLDVVQNPEPYLEKLLLEDGVNQFQKEFLIEHGIYLTIDDAAKIKLLEKSKSENKKVRVLCNELFGDYFHGIRLMKLENFNIPGEAVDDPKAFLDAYIKKNYRQ
ncbi:MAG: AAA domain-containing protein [Spirochaetes bacterium]|nr:AAA domain-containing protein [Spirochaetota bacterium]